MRASERLSVGVREISKLIEKSIQAPIWRGEARKRGPALDMPCPTRLDGFASNPTPPDAPQPLAGARVEKLRVELALFKTPKALEKRLTLTGRAAKK